ncbi:hypothetical protein KJ910_05045 [Patescibacteria group bacterium]|nr:hypothetical protein [Patescibacteria group bacterium]
MLEKVLFIGWTSVLVLSCGLITFVLSLGYYDYPLGESLAHTLETVVVLPIAIAISLKIWPPVIDRVTDTPITQSLDFPKDSG